MIARSQPVCRGKPSPPWHEGFLAMLPRINAYARFAFRHLDPEAKQEAVQSVVGGALAAYVRLVELGKADIAYPAPLAMYAVRQHRDGRRPGTKMNSCDVSSEYAQKAKAFRLGRLDHLDRDSVEWREVLIEDRHAGPAETACARIDFTAWLRSLPSRSRRIAQFLAAGNRTCDAARKFGVCAGRISQIRKELKLAWQMFHGETLKPETATA